MSGRVHDAHRLVAADRTPGDGPRRSLFATVDVDAGRFRVRPVHFVKDSGHRWTLDTSVFEVDGHEGVFDLPRPPRRLARL